MIYLLLLNLQYIAFLILFYSKLYIFAKSVIFIISCKVIKYVMYKENLKECLSRFHDLPSIIKSMSFNQLDVINISILTDIIFASFTVLIINMLEHKRIIYIFLIVC